MDLKVRFRFNTATGEVEVFEVDHEGDQNMPESEHNALHDSVAAELGRTLERFARVEEIDPSHRGQEIPVTEPEEQAGLAEQDRTDEREKQKGKR